jgi:hypothetical protein
MAIKNFCANNHATFAERAGSEIFMYSCSSHAGACRPKKLLLQFPASAILQNIKAHKECGVISADNKKFT